MTTTDQPVGVLKLISRGPFARLWWSGLLSSLGDWVAFFAILSLADRVGNEVGIVLALVARVVPAFLFSGFGGVLADRVDRKWLMVSGDIGRAVLVLSLIFVDSVLGLVVMSAILEMFSLLFQPAKEATVPNLVDEESLPTANSLSLTAAYGTFPIGAGIIWAMGYLPRIDNSLAVTTAEIGAFIFDAFTFALSALLLVGLKVPTSRHDTQKREQKTTALTDLVDGIKFVAADRGIRPVVFGMGLALLGGGVLIVLGNPFARDVLNADERGFYIILFALGTGAALGMGVIGVLGSRTVRPSILFSLSLLLIGGSLMAASAITTVFGAAAWILVVGLGTGAAYVMGFTHLQTEVDDDYRGRAFAAMLAVLRLGLLASMAVALPLKTLLGGLLPGLLSDGIRAVMLLGGAVVLTTGLVTLWSQREIIKGARLSSAARATLDEVARRRSR
ncbi:MAG: MFS transporter [Acidimicrobiia bacterium]|nr:MFS transporter [Acidimicrobiia bacterium]